MSYELFKICLDKATRGTQCDDPDKEIEKKHRLLFEDLMSPMPNAWDVYSGYHSIIDWHPIEESSYTRYIENNMKYLFSDNFEDHFEWAHALMMYYRHGGDITKYIEKILEHPTMHIKIMVEFDVFLDKFESRLPEIMEDVSDCISHILNRDTQKLLLEAYENAETPLPKEWVDNWYPLPRKGTRWEKFEEFENTINPLFGFHADNNDEMIINSFAAVFSAIQMVETIHFEKYKRVNAHLGMEYGEEERAPMKSKFAGLRQRALVMHEKLTHLFKIFKGDENHQLIYQRWMSLPAFFTAWGSYTKPGIPDTTEEYLSTKELIEKYKSGFQDEFPGPLLIEKYVGEFCYLLKNGKARWWKLRKALDALQETENFSNEEVHAQNLAYSLSTQRYLREGWQLKEKKNNEAG